MPSKDSYITLFLSEEEAGDLTQAGISFPEPTEDDLGTVPGTWLYEGRGSGLVFILEHPGPPVLSLPRPWGVSADPTVMGLTN